MKDMKWYIFNPNEEPLCWDEKALEFDTKEDAEVFLKSADIPMEEVSIENCIFYYDGGYLNASNLIINDDNLEER